MLTAANRLYGPNAFETITSVACGHSGPNCLAGRLAEKIAKFAQKEYVHAFDALSVTTKTSHPINNRSRPMMNISQIPKGPILLIDDVATSGSHIHEATIILRNHNIVVIPLVWISA